MTGSASNNNSIISPANCSFIITYATCVIVTWVTGASKEAKCKTGLDEQWKKIIHRPFLHLLYMGKRQFMVVLQGEFEKQRQNNNSFIWAWPVWAKKMVRDTTVDCTFQHKCGHSIYWALNSKLSYVNCYDCFMFNLRFMLHQSYFI